MPGPGTTVYVYDIFGKLAAEYSDQAAANTACRTCYLTVDHLGSTRLVTDQAGLVIGRHDYLPFGEEIPAGFAGRGVPFGATDSVHQKFTGQERDSDTSPEPDFFQARYLSAAIGRFTSPDPLGMFAADPTNPQSWNQYSYVLNNPLGYSDPSGANCISLDGGGTGDDGQGTPCPGSSDPSTTNVNGGTIDPIFTVPSYPISNGGGFGGANPFGMSTTVIGPQQQSSPTNSGPAYCAYQGATLSPQAYAAQGKSLSTGIAALSQAYAPDVAFSFGLGTLYGQFSKGSALDAQPKASGTTLQKASYGNYAYGAFFAGAGVPLSDALAAANAYGFKQQVTGGAYANRTMDSKYSHLPVVNVQDIVNGYSAASRATLCHR